MNHDSLRQMGSSRVDPGYRYRDVRIGRAVALRLHLRSLSVCMALLCAVIALSVLSLGLGDYPLSPAQVIEAMLGGGTKLQRTIVMDWRLPVVIAAACFGAVLGAGGAIFQSLTRNPLGSPDVIGFDAGAYTAVVVSVLFFGSAGYWHMAGAALAGGLLTAFAVYALAYRRGVQGFRLIIVGIAISAMLGSVNSYLITRADLNDAMSVGFWGAGSLSRVTWTSLVPSIIAAAVILVCAALLTPALCQLELGDDSALALGVRANRARLALLVVGVASSALVTAAAGPLSFIALSAPQLARRLTRTAGVSVGAAACMGAALLAGAQLLALIISQIFQTVPVGLVTVCLGGMYLIWLLIRETRKAL